MGAGAEERAAPDLYCVNCVPEFVPWEAMSMSTARTTTTSAGISLGAAIAVTISWSQHASILWAILHGILGWLYVIYFAITR